jgi:hypothetical protein
MLIGSYSVSVELRGKFYQLLIYFPIDWLIVWLINWYRMAQVYTAGWTVCDRERNIISCEFLWFTQEYMPVPVAVRSKT